MLPTVRTGLERLLAYPKQLAGKAIALIANHTSVTCRLQYGWDALSSAGLEIARIFSPEHGLFGIEQDQVPAGTPREMLFEIVSLYGTSAQSLAPMRAHLEGIDCVLFDIQDVGSRYYTYLNTMVLFLRELDGLGIPFYVLDRPNPLGGDTVEGPVLKKGFESFVGLLPVSVRHGLTAGEIARLAHRFFNLNVELNVIEMQGWRRWMRFEDTGLPWVPPSPNMPGTRTAAVYPGTCLFEGTNVSEGRGTTTPFECIGAPGVRPKEIARAIEEMGIEGVVCRPTFFRPTFGKYAGQECGGVYLHVTDTSRFTPFRTGVALVAVFRKMMDGFAFSHDVYEFNTEVPAFDLLVGSSTVREMILGDEPFDAVVDSWKKDEDLFSDMKEEFHIYG